MKEKQQKDYWLDPKTGKPKYEFNELYENINDPWKCSKLELSDALNSYLFLEMLFFNNMKYENILDIGCGLGWFSNEINNRNIGNLLATDISDVAIKKAKNIFPKLNFKKFDIINDSPFNRTFNLINMSEVLWYFISHTDIVFDKIISMLSVDGVFALKQDFPNNQKYFKEYLNGYREFLILMEKKGFSTNKIIIIDNFETKVLLASYKYIL